MKITHFQKLSLLGNTIEVAGNLKFNCWLQSRNLDLMRKWCIITIYLCSVFDLFDLFEVSLRKRFHFVNYLHYGIETYLPTFYTPIANNFRTHKCTVANIRQEWHTTQIHTNSLFADEAFGDCCYVSGHFFLSLYLHLICEFKTYFAYFLKTQFINNNRW